jgi:4-hydroxy-2-oxoheptanedioate aldolase
MQRNITKEKLESGQCTFGCFLRTHDPTVVELLGYQGLDFVIFDAEHGTIEPRDCEQMVRAAELVGVTPIVRVVSNDAGIVLRYMDTGAQGIHFPSINTVEEAKTAISSVKYPPEGSRGLGTVRASCYGQRSSLGCYADEANMQSMIVLQIESRKGVENIAKITTLSEIDVVFIGPTDLCQSYALPDQISHPIIQSAIDKVIEASVQSGVGFGAFAKDPHIARDWCDRGASYIAIGFESAVRLGVHEFRNALGKWKNPSVQGGKRHKNVIRETRETSESTRR